MRTLIAVGVALVGGLGFGQALRPGSGQAGMIEWPFYGADQAGTKWSAAADINRENVSKLEVAWTWKPGEKPLPEFRTQPGSFENTPLMIDNVLYISTPYNRVVALDAESGRELWAYDPRGIDQVGCVYTAQGFEFDYCGVIANCFSASRLASTSSREISAQPARCPTAPGSSTAVWRPGAIRGSCASSSTAATG